MGITEYPGGRGPTNAQEDDMERFRFEYRGIAPFRARFEQDERGNWRYVLIAAAECGPEDEDAARAANELVEPGEELLAYSYPIKDGCTHIVYAAIACPCEQPYIYVGDSEVTLRAAEFGDPNSLLIADDIEKFADIGAVHFANGYPIRGAFSEAAYRDISHLFKLAHSLKHELESTVSAWELGRRADLLKQILLKLLAD
jgi:hypothetical protein